MGGAKNMVDSTLPGERTQPLRPHDPGMLGDYELLGRLGEGGMGTVYLGRRQKSDVLVAVKVVRLDLAHDDEFRRRFRSEVDRARQVPPFCTAEVLDADPDHERPYLVVEYVDGPTLAEVVEQRGPLTSANLHSVAIGVATALTAIHGAGVIHRDLKPRNVLLAPGSPKVIDFGIARAMAMASENTRPDQMVGTVAYMAPERFNTDADTPVITPAADVFAWGSVVTYAGTGKTPFYADSPPATAARILTQPPRLHGLNRPLRNLVAHALEKDPANRPSARELLDLLISGEHPAAVAAALADQPDLQAAAVEAQAVTGFAVTGRTAAPVTTPVAATAAGATTAPVLDIPPGLVGYDENSIVTVPISPAASTTVSGGSRSPEPARRWVLPAAVALLAVALVAGIAIAAAVMKSRSGDAAKDAAATPRVTEGAALGAPLISDALAAPKFWIPTALDKAPVNQGAHCAFVGGELVAVRENNDVYRCKGPADVLPADLTAEVGVRLEAPGSCAGIWFRFVRVPKLHGYQARVCENHIYVGLHQSDGDVSTLRTFVLPEPIALNAEPTRITLRVRGGTVTVSRDGAEVGSAALTEKDLGAGQLHLGVFSERDAPALGPYQVAFSDIKIYN
ncbi:serine/threonine protein kinase [Actinoplanes palleronii]|uniref:serine/threonine protein kinase n=1 Tax=Actinoplanes palleronii TaxID=113570 RepID=UPI001EF258F4|nr:serine/threonine-protein kinase [Actinoplanes palleronii]